MKLVLSLSTLALFSTACGQTEKSPDAQTYIAPEPEEEATVSDPLIADFVWNTTASDMTDEELADIVTRWNARIDAAGYDMVGANILKPQFEEERYDFIWVLMWPSSDARDAAWADWNANQLEDWTAELDGALSYDEENIFTLTMAQRSPRSAWMSHAGNLFNHHVWHNQISNIPLDGRFQSMRCALPVRF